MNLYLDTETYSETPIADGTYKYAENAEVMLFAYAYGESDEPAVIDFTAGEKIPTIVMNDLLNPACTKVIQNSMFDRNVLRYDIGVDIPHEQIFDTMVCALAHSLPGALAVLGEVFGVKTEDKKHDSGKNLIQFFCKPRPKNQTIRRYTRETHPKEWQEFKEYAKSDIRAMRTIRNKIPTWNYSDRELALWGLDQRINDRGFAVDRDLAAKAIAAITEAQRRLGADIFTKTFGEVERATQRDRMLAHILRVYGVELPDLTKATLERRLNDPDLPSEIKDLLSIRQEASMASTSKYKALLKSVSGDGRLRGTLQFCGASRTGRWSGRTFQPQNLFRPTMPVKAIDAAIGMIKNNTLDLVMGDRSVMESCANAVRGCIVAPPCKKLVIADLSNIEGRFAAWVAGEEWKCRAFRDFDNGIGADLYKVAYAKAFNITPEAVTKDQRQIGKVMELMLQYEGGVGAFLTGAASYKIDLDEMAEAAWPVIPAFVKDKAINYWLYCQEQKISTFDLKQKTFVVCDALKRMWRAAHPKISGMWPALREAMTNAYNRPGEEFFAERVSIRRDGSWTKIRLPSGRYLCYPSVKINDKGELSYMGVNPYTRQWGRIKTYGGKLFENICQGGARDVMTANMPMIDEFGFSIVLTVHDELITEAPDSDAFTAQKLSDFMSHNPEWAKGLPLAAGGFEAYRYRKDS